MCVPCCYITGTVGLLIRRRTVKRSEYMKEEIRHEPDGTWTVDTGWHDPIKGIPTRALAVTIQDALGEAMVHYADIMYCED